MHGLRQSKASLPETGLLCASRGAGTFNPGRSAGIAICPANAARNWHTSANTCATAARSAAGGPGGRVRRGRTASTQAPSPAAPERSTLSQDRGWSSREGRRPSRRLAARPSSCRRTSARLHSRSRLSPADRRRAPEPSCSTTTPPNTCARANCNARRVDDMTALVSDRCNDDTQTTAGAGLLSSVTTKALQRLEAGRVG